MNKNQTATYNSFISTDKTLIKFLPEWTGNVKFKSIVDDKFRPVLIEIKKYKKDQEANIIGIRENKLAKQQSMADKSFAISNAVQAMASDLEDNSLFQLVNYSPRDLMKGREENCVDKARIIEGAARTHAAALLAYSVTEAMLDVFLSSIEEFEASIPDSRNAINAKKIATTQLPILFKKGRAIITRSMKKAAAQFKESSFQFFNELIFSFSINGLPTHHTDIDFMITEKGSGKVLPGVKVIAIPVSAPEEKIIQYSTMQGEADYKAISPELYNVTFQLPDHETASTMVQPQRGKKLEMKIELVKIAG
ncbi:MAG: hypothetical protein ABIT08_05035 [Bacteroidia bacterium]